MDGFELDMRQSGFNQNRGFVRAVVHKKLQIAHQTHYFAGKRRHINGIAGAAAAYPILAGTEPTRLATGAPPLG